MKSLSRQNIGPWGGLRLGGVAPAQPAAALRQRMWRSRTEVNRALDPDGLGGQVGEEVSGAGWRGPGRTGVGDLGREPQVGEERSYCSGEIARKTFKFQKLNQQKNWAEIVW